MLNRVKKVCDIIVYPQIFVYLQKFFIVSNKQNVRLWRIREFYGRYGTLNCSFRSLCTCYWSPTSSACVVLSSISLGNYGKTKQNTVSGFHR